ncbi:MAG: two-component response regulator [Bacteroidetes bacterium]|jgi:CheY-like chemotaxis protein|nr:two-component response regulator [Bacteroidota bacterium]
MKHSTILLVEDDYLDVVSVQRAFKKLNIDHTLHIAHNGVDALGMLTDEKSKLVPDIILLDINMPKMNGLEFVRIIKNYYSLKNIKIFMITTSGEEYDRIAAESMGVTGYIIKPLNFKDPDSAGTRKLMEELLQES